MLIIMVNLYSNTLTHYHYDTFVYITVKQRDGASNTLALHSKVWKYRGIPHDIGSTSKHNFRQFPETAVPTNSTNSFAGEQLLYIDKQYYYYPIVHHQYYRHCIKQSAKPQME